MALPSRVWTAVAAVEGVAKRRALRMRGGEADFEKASAVLLQDYRDGKLGRVSLETPSTREVMLAKWAEARAKPSTDAVEEAAETDVGSGV